MRLRKSSSLLCLLLVPTVLGAGPALADKRPVDEVQVTVTIENDQPVATPDPVQIKAGKQYIHWSTEAGTLQITFKKESPFSEKPKHAGKSVKSGKPLKGKEGKYAYAIEIKLPNGKVLVADPDVEVLP